MTKKKPVDQCAGNKLLHVRKQAFVGQVIERVLRAVDVPLASRDGSRSLPYTSIQGAINAASGPCEVVVHPGCDRESVRTGEHNVSIIGQVKSVWWRYMGSWDLTLTRRTQVCGKGGPAITVGGPGHVSIRNCSIYGDVHV